ncbi:MAG: LysR substrate-binding domain-containing protein [Pseudomonadota bacterium]
MMSKRAIPSLRGLRTFCVAARYQSFKLAADDLFITASAVSHQIKNLEAFLNVSLFDRSGRELMLTSTGQSLYDELRPLVQAMDEAVVQHRSVIERASVRVSVQPFFASEYFVPRLSDFNEAYPHIDVVVGSSDETAERHPTDADLSIRLFSEPPKGLSSRALFPLRLVPAGSPDFYANLRFDSRRIESEFPLIVHDTLADAWSQWSAASGIKLPPNSKVTRLDSMIAVLRATQRSIGAALVPVPMGELWFSEGSVVRLFEQDLIADQSYYVVWEPDAEVDPAIAAVTAWVLETFANVA